MNLRSISSLKNLNGKRVLVRVDFNVAIRHGQVSRQEEVRIRAALPTMEWLLEHGAQVILATHLGRPEGQYVAALSTKQLIPVLSKLLGTSVRFVPQLSQLGHGKIGKVLLLENLRFWPGEEKNDPRFARQLAALADFFVNEAFSVSHRAHASLAGVAKFLPSYAGFLLEREISSLDRVLKQAARPRVLIIGGIKIRTKLPMIRHLLPRVDTILVGGALARITQRIHHRKIVLPIDARGSGLDIGPRTLRLFGKHLKGARTIIWNGPLGKCEDRRYSYGTYAIARLVARLTKQGAFSVVGGGDTIAVLQKIGVYNSMSFVSTGGGAMLHYLAGKSLPGLRALIE